MTNPTFALASVDPRYRYPAIFAREDIVSDIFEYRIPQKGKRYRTAIGKILWTVPFQAPIEGLPEVEIVSFSTRTIRSRGLLVEATDSEVLLVQELLVEAALNSAIDQPTAEKEFEMIGKLCLLATDSRGNPNERQLALARVSARRRKILSLIGGKNAE